MKLSSRRLLKAFSLALLHLAVMAQAALSHQHGAYSHDATIGYSNPHWMSLVPGQFRLSDLSLPGTHQSLSRHGGEHFVTQTMHLTTQLNAGIRVLDVRCRHINDSFAIHHGKAFQHAYFDSGVLEPIIAFLQESPHETVLMRVMPAHTEVNNTRSFEETFEYYMGIYGQHVWTPTSQNPTLDEVRGKIVILQDFDSTPANKFGLNYGAFDTQDNFRLWSNWDLYDKWLDVKNHFARSESGSPDTFYLNYLSGVGPISPPPYFVASGHSSSGTSAPRLATGLTTPGFNSSYPDFPRIDCFLGICTIAFEGTNILAQQYIRDNKAGICRNRDGGFPRCCPD